MMQNRGEEIVFKIRKENEGKQGFDRFYRFTDGISERVSFSYCQSVNVISCFAVTRRSGTPDRLVTSVFPRVPVYCGVPGY